MCSSSWDQTYRFAFVSNSGVIADAVYEYAVSQGFQLNIRLASMEKALPVAQEMLKAGAEVILGGGGTGRLLRRQLAQPVVTIARSHLDLLEAFLKAREYTDCIALTCYETVPENFRLFAELLHIKLKFIIFTSTNTLITGISQSIREGAGCIVGGGICAEVARAQGCKAVVVTPGPEAIRRALEEAVNIAVSQRREREKAAWLRGILDSLNEGIIGVNVAGEVITRNDTAARLLGQAGEDKNMPRLLRELGIARSLQHAETEQDSVRQAAGQELIVNIRPVLVSNTVQGAVAAFRPSSYIRNVDDKIKARLRDKGFTARFTLDDLEGGSPVMSRLRARAARFARTDAALLIQGESGSGKELLAHGIHQADARRGHPFVAFNCAALPENLLESELFGYEEGAFTGAKKGGKNGLFVLADGGSIFLDEIGDIPPSLQVRLLRVLEAQEVMRVGGDRVISVNVRVLSSSWKNLADEVRAGRFRADLYYRLSTLCLHMPSLRERLQDIPTLIAKFLRRESAPEKCFSSKGMHMLMSYAWPGNVRELGALVRRYTLLLPSEEPDDSLLEELLEELRATNLAHAPVSESGSQPFAFDAEQGLHSLKDRLEAHEKELIRRTLESTGQNRVQAAKVLGVSANTLWRKMKGM